MAVSGKGRTCVADIEGDNLYPAITKVHCIVAIDVDTGEVFDWGPGDLEAGVRFLSECAALIGHNFIDYDVRALKKIFPWFIPPAIIWDTLLMCRVVWPADTLIGRDLKLRDIGRLPAKFIKAHSLAAWGYRLGVHKGDYDGGWESWSEAMHAYMIQDAHVNVALWRLLRRRIGWDEPGPNTYVWPVLPFEIEFGCARIVSDQETAGFAFDRDKAVALAQRLQNLASEIEAKLVDHFGSWWAPKDNPHTGRPVPRSMKRKATWLPDVTVARTGKNGQALKPYVGPPLEEFTQGCPYVRIERVTFSPGSRDHIGQRLQVAYGWRPQAFGKDGKPTLDEDTIRLIPEDVLAPEFRTLLLDYFTITKTLGQLATGRKSWLSAVTEAGRIHGRVNTVGTISGRASHYDPNLSQAPAVSKDREGNVLMDLAGAFGWECRSLFTASEGNELTGSDATGLELIGLGHYLAPLDGGEFADRVSDPERDPHTEHSEITGESRDDTKTVTYAYIYGAGADKVGQSLTVTDEEIPDLITYKALPGMLRWKERIEGPDYVEPDDRTKARMAKGHALIRTFEQKIPGLKDLKAGVCGTGGERGWLKGLDGRKLYIRKKHAALNQLLQGAGAIICKLWMVLTHEKLAALGLVSGVDYQQVVWSHDELQFDHKPGLGEIIGKASGEAIREAGERLGMRATLRGAHKTGRTWAETH